MGSRGSKILTDLSAQHVKIVEPLRVQSKLVMVSVCTELLTNAGVSTFVSKIASVLPPRTATIFAAEGWCRRPEGLVTVVWRVFKGLRRVTPSSSPPVKMSPVEKQLRRPSLVSVSSECASWWLNSKAEMGDGWERRERWWCESKERRPDWEIGRTATADALEECTYAKCSVEAASMLVSPTTWPGERSV